MKWTRSRAAAGALCGVALLLVAARQREADPSADGSGPNDAVVESPAGPVPARLIRVPLPLTGNTDTQIMTSVDKLLSDLPPSDQRPILVFEFRPRDERAPGVSRFERALALARYLASGRFSRVRTVAYVAATIEGHAVLPVLACEEIIMSPDAKLGAAGKDESRIDVTMMSAYRDMAERRRTIPAAVVLGMLDRDLSVTKVQLVDGGVRYVLPDELARLRAEAKVVKEETVIPEGDLGTFTGRQLRLEYGFASYLAANRKELAEALEIPPDSLRDKAATASWRALRINIRGRISSRTAREAIQTIREAQKKKKVNLVCFSIESPGGEPAAALQLVNFLTSLDPSQVRTVAYVGHEARSLAAVVALACDEVYAAEEAQLGGPGDPSLAADDLEDIRTAVQDAARAKQRDWSLPMGLLDSRLAVYRFQREGTNEERYFCEQERGERRNPDQWNRQGNELELDAGVTGLQARQYRLIDGHADNLKTVLGKFNIDEEIAVAERNPVVSAIERLAAQPWFGRTLLFIAFFALISEASAPGIGAPGFVSVLCFLLFFWCQFLNGTAGWLELLLFAGGVICIGLEIFVIPGFGIFGIGGTLMVLTSIVLASQTFIVPHNSYQLEQVPGSLFTVVFAAGGVLAGLWFMRRILPETPILRRLILPPPPDEEVQDELESIVDWRYLEGKRGVTTTQLTPSGKARFGDDVVNVISDGVVIARGTPITVTRVQGNRVLVEAVEES